MRSHLAILVLFPLFGACANEGIHHCTGTCSDGGTPHDAGGDAAPLDAASDAGAHDGGAAHDGATDAGSAPDGAPTDGGGATDAGTHPDAGGHPDAGSPDAGLSDAGSALDAGPGCPPGTACTLLDFPNLSDTYSTTFYMNTGDYVEGMRVTALPSATGAHVVMNVRFDDLMCDSLDFRVLLNSTEIGTFSIVPPTSPASPIVIDQSYTFPAVTGPSYTVRYEVVHGVMPSCGPVVLETHGNSVALSP